MTRHLSTYRRLVAIGWLLVCAPCAAAGFATDRQQMLEALLTDAGGVRTKSLGGPATAPGTVKVLREGGPGDKGARVVGVVERRPDVASVNLRVEFAHDSARLDERSRRVLQELGAALVDDRLKGSRILINGHTDSSGDDHHNLDLSFRRAASVREFLVGTLGLPLERLAVQGFGEAVPLNANADETQRQLNRRVEIERRP